MRKEGRRESPSVVRTMIKRAKEENKRETRTSFSRIIIIVFGFVVIGQERIKRAAVA